MPDSDQIIGAERGATPAEVALCEVCMRDGLQMHAEVVPTETKLELVDAILRTGIERIELGSFVNPRILPQMADIRELLAAVPPRPAVEYSVLVPNRRGYDSAMEAGARHIVYVVSASDAHSLSNVGCTAKAAMDELTRVLRQPPAGRFRFNLATAFHCPFSGTTELDVVLGIVEQVLALHPDAEVCLCDTTGHAVPVQVETAFAEVGRRFGPAVTLAYHAHDTFSMGAATTYAAYRAGVRVFDGAMAGLGGCPFAPGASGNVATEDVAHMFAESGLLPGLDFEAVMDCSALVQARIASAPGGRVGKACDRRT